MEVKLINGSRFENEAGKRVDIQMKNSNIYYRVPEDMMPFAAASKVEFGLADWVERRERTFADKLTTAVNNVKQTLTPKSRTQPDEIEVSHRESEKAVLREVAALPVRRPTIPFIDTDRDGEASIVS